MVISAIKDLHAGHHKTYSRKLLFWLVGIILLMGCVHLFMQYLNFEVYNEKHGAIYELSNRFDFDDEASVMTWLAQFQFLLLAAACFFAASLEKIRALRLLWITAGSASVAFSIDETATLHEFVLQRIHVAFYQDAEPTLLSNSWIIVLPLILLIGYILAKIMFRYLPKRTIGLISVGSIIFVTGAVIVDLVTQGTPGRPFISQGIFVAIEEICEFLGLAIVIYAVTSYIEQVYGKTVGRAVKQLRS